MTVRINVLQLRDVLITDEHPDQISVPLRLALKDSVLWSGLASSPVGPFDNGGQGLLRLHPRHACQIDVAREKLSLTLGQRLPLLVKYVEVRSVLGSWPRRRR